MTEDNEGYTRVRFHIQRGSGTDNRGETTVEVTRPTDDAQPNLVRKEAEEGFSEAKEHLEDELDL